MDNEFKIDCCLRGLCAKGCGRQDKQLNTYDYLAGIPGNSNASDLVEVQFKHTRKGYYRNDNHLPLEKGDMVAVEATPGHDIGVVTLTGLLVPLQMKKANLKPGVEIKRVYRKARPADIDQYEAAKSLEQDTMIRSRKIAQDLNLNMKIGDVEYQGDGNKAIFYYIADARVDFRQLIKVLADAFHVRIEMKQIGARQEAGRIGGIGPCGRELCCATWMKNFNSVSTTAARFQDISPNPQKLAGQCAKLKCCLNYEVDTYVEASKKLPQRDAVLETQDATYFLFKTDILAGLVTYSTDKRMAANLVVISAERAKAVIQMNKNGEKPLTLDDTVANEPARPVDLVEQEDLHRFDKSKKRKNGKNNRRATSGEVKRENSVSKDGQANKTNVTRDKQSQEVTSAEANKDKRNNKGQQRQSLPKEEGEADAVSSANPNQRNGERRNSNNRQRGNRNANMNKPNPSNNAKSSNDTANSNANSKEGQRPNSAYPQNPDDLAAAPSVAVPKKNRNADRNAEGRDSQLSEKSSKPNNMPAGSKPSREVKPGGENKEGEKERTKANVVQKGDGQQPAKTKDFPSNTNNSSSPSSGSNRPSPSKESNSSVVAKSDNEKSSPKSTNPKATGMVPAGEKPEEKPERGSRDLPSAKPVSNVSNLNG